MDSQALTQTISLISSHGYWFLFFAMVIEGPIVTTAAAFASALGFFNIYTIFFLTLGANFLADIVFYQLGYWGRKNVVEKLRGRLGVGESKVKKIEGLLEKNLLTALAVIKLTPGLPPIGLTLVGASRMSFSKFIKINLLIALPYALFFVILGYYAGLANAVAEKYLHHSQYWLALTVIAIFIGSYIYKKVSTAIAQKIEKI